MTETTPTRLLFLLMAFGAQLTANAQTTASFSVEPSEARVSSGFGLLGEQFTFTAEVPQANCYRLDYGDRDSSGRPYFDISPGEDGGAVFVHRYAQPGRYTARMRAWRVSSCDETASSLPPLRELSLGMRVNPIPVAQAVRPAPPPLPPPVQLPPREIVVELPLPEESVQWPPLRPEAPTQARPPEPDVSSILPWLLLVAAIALLRPGDGGATLTERVSFELTRDRGRGKVIGSASADQAAALRVSWRQEPNYLIAGDARLTGTRSGPLRIASG